MWNPQFKFWLDVEEIKQFTFKACAGELYLCISSMCDLCQLEISEFFQYYNGSSLDWFTRETVQLLLSMNILNSICFNQ